MSLVKSAKILGILGAMSFSGTALAAEKPVEVRVVVVSAFEIGNDQGDTAGEFQNWVEKFPLNEEISAPDNGHGHYRFNSKLGVLGIVAGEGHINAAQSLTALALDKRFDLSHAYFILAGIAGGNPYQVSLGGAAWAKYVVNGGLMHALDRDDAPKNWVDNYIPVQGFEPYPQPRPEIHSKSGDMAWRLNGALVDWAYNLTKRTKLSISPEVRKHAALYAAYSPNAVKARVSEGDTMSSDMFWNGAKMNAWAQRWVKYWTDDRGVFATTAMEDSAFVQALHQEAVAGRVDENRILVLRTVSNYDMPPPGGAAADEFKHGEIGYAGLKDSTTNAYLVASPVVKKLAKGWDVYKDNIPK